jgi:hypothetical protein
MQRYRVHFGGHSPAQLLQRLQAQGVALNTLASAALAHPGFEVTDPPRWATVVALRVAALGWAQGATMPEILKVAQARGLVPTPVDLAPSLRLLLLEQAEVPVADPTLRHRAPPGSLTVVSRPLSDDDEVPKGFYLRRIDGRLWLRGYRSDNQHLWSPEDELAFLQGPAAA